MTDRTACEHFNEKMESEMSEQMWSCEPVAVKVVSHDAIEKDFEVLDE